MRTCTLNEEMAKNLTKSQTLGLLLGILRHQQAEKKMKLCCSIASPQRLSAFTSLAFICVYVIVAMLHPKRLSIYLKYRYIIQSRRSECEKSISSLAEPQLLTLYILLFLLCFIVRFFRNVYRSITSPNPTSTFVVPPSPRVSSLQRASSHAQSCLFSS